MPASRAARTQASAGVLLDLGAVGDPVAVRDLADDQAGTAEVTEFHVPTLTPAVTSRRPAERSEHRVGVGEQPVDLVASPSSRLGGAPASISGRPRRSSAPQRPVSSPNRNATGWITSVGCTGGTSTAPVRSTTPLRPPSVDDGQALVGEAVDVPAVGQRGGEPVVAGRHDDPAGAGPPRPSAAAAAPRPAAAERPYVVEAGRMTTRLVLSIADPAAPCRPGDTQASPSEKRPTPEVAGARVDQQSAGLVDQLPASATPAGGPRPTRRGTAARRRTGRDDQFAVGVGVPPAVRALVEASGAGGRGLEDLVPAARVRPAARSRATRREHRVERQLGPRRSARGRRPCAGSSACSKCWHASM